MTNAPAPTYCPCCERVAPLMECGLCDLCSAAEPLRAAYCEGIVRLRAVPVTTEE